MNRPQSFDEDLNSFLNQELLPPSFVNWTYSFVLSHAVVEARRAGRKWRQEEIASETGIGRRTLQKFISAEELPAQDGMNKLALVLHCEALKRTPLQIETKKGLKTRVNHEAFCAEALVEHRNPRLIAEINGIANAYEQAKNWEERSRCDLNMHHLSIRYHSDPVVRRWLYELQWRRITYFAYNARFLNISEFRDRLSSHKEAHQNLVGAYLSGTVQDIEACVSEHNDFLIKNAATLEVFHKNNPRPESWGS